MLDLLNFFFETQIIIAGLLNHNYFSDAFGSLLDLLETQILAGFMYNYVLYHFELILNFFELLFTLAIILLFYLALWKNHTKSFIFQAHMQIVFLFLFLQLLKLVIIFYFWLIQDFLPGFKLDFYFVFLSEIIFPLFLIKSIMITIAVKIILLEFTEEKKKK